MRPPDALYRSYLYVVGYREDHIAKAYASDVDAVILELEDAVAPDRKEDARRVIRATLQDAPPKPTLVRINPIGSGHTRADLDAVADLPLVAIRVAKVESASDVRLLSTWLTELGSDLPLHLLLESAQAIERASEVLAADPRVTGVGIGEQDLAADLGVSSDDGLAYARSRVVTAAAAAGIAPPVQSVWTDIRDLDGLRVSCDRGRRLGFVGRPALHPAQIEAINEAYTPSAADVADAEHLQAAFDEAIATGEAGFTLPDGRFVDRAVVRSAQRTLALYRGSS
jgi:citrate lyase subunit beta / citryl-CoA lyase